MHKNIGKILRIVGVCLIAAGLILVGYNMMIQRKGDERAESLVNGLNEITALKSDEDAYSREHPDYLVDPNLEMPTVIVDDMELVGKIELPTILDKELPILSDWSDGNLEYGPCRYQGSVYSDSLVIAGHNYRGYFGALKNIGLGDPVIVTDVEGNVFNYEVVDMEILDGTDVKNMVTGDWDLTIFTCTLDRVTRVTVRCDRVDAQ